MRDYELVPLKEDWAEYFENEVKPFAPDAWVDENHTDHEDGGVGRLGYEINFNRYFKPYTPHRNLKDINKDIKELISELSKKLEVMAA